MSVAEMFPLQELAATDAKPPYNFLIMLNILNL